MFSVMTVKKFLADLYGYTQGYQYNQLSEERLEKKIMYYQNFLDTIGKVDPGYTKVSKIQFSVFFREIKVPLFFSGEVKFCTKCIDQC